MGFVVPRAVGPAVTRNRVRRRLRHLRAGTGWTGCPTGTRLVVRVLPAAAASASLAPQLGARPGPGAGPALVAVVSGAA